ncbi:MAG TPA: hypothetical protein PKV21_03565 [bacterium]|nr:hypothetical protein [bacterium]
MKLKYCQICGKRIRKTNPEEIFGIKLIVCIDCSNVFKKYEETFHSIKNIFKKLLENLKLEMVGLETEIEKSLKESFLKEIRKKED